MSTTAGTGGSFELGRQRVDGGGTGGIGTIAGQSAGAAHHGPTAMGGYGPWFRLFLRISGTALAVALALGLVVVLTATAAKAQPPAAADQVRQPAVRTTALQRLDAHQGSGMILTGSHGATAAPQQSTDARLRVTGTTVRGTVTQRFHNPSSEWLEGSYLFPLPDDAAVDHLRMKVGERVVQGEIREKFAAQKEFARARSQGRRAALVEQQRPNVFTSRVTNIPPGAVIEVELEYQQTLALRDGAWRLRFPGVVAPRYGHAEAAPADADINFDSSVSQPLQHPDEPALNPLRITVELDPGMPIVQPVSRSHRLAVSSGNATVSGGVIRYRLQTIADHSAHEVADRDFELAWSPAAGALPTAALRHERRGDAHYGLLVINPPTLALAPAERLPREMTFVIDTSGSMAGESIEQARNALAFGLERLHRDDRFNIIQFNSNHASLFTVPREASFDNLRQARRYVNDLHASGGTEMRGAVAQALSAPAADRSLGQVVFITDGAVDYEDELVSLVRQRIGARRLFTVGIGSAPNGFFMRKVAEIGGGTFTFIGDTGEVERRMAQLFEKIAQPLSTDLKVTFEGGTLAEPIAMPRDLYAGEPLVLAARFSELPRAVVVSGAAGSTNDSAADESNGAGGRWRIPVTITAAPDSGLHVLWARQRIDALSDAIRQARHTAAPQDDLRMKVVALAVRHHLVSDYTSLVAVDTTPAWPQGAPLQRGAVPANLPAGWDHEALTGPGAGSAASGGPAPSPRSAAGAPALARTSTSAALQLLVGVVLLVTGFLLLLSRRGSRLLAPSAGR